MKIAAFDIGTNSIHCLIVEINKDLSYEILDHEKEVARIGDGSFEKGELSKDAIHRAVDAIDRFHKIAQKNGVKKTIAVATSAVREAKNSREFLSAVFRKTRLRVQVISGKEEARLIFLGAKSSIETKGERVLVADIGGGSVELVLGDRKRSYFLESFKLGAARLTDHFIRHDPPSEKNLRALESFIQKEIEPAVDPVRKIGFSMMIGTAGTMMNLAAIAYQMNEKKPIQQVNHSELSRKDLQKIHKKISGMNLKERLRFPGLDPKRADIIVAGSTVALALMRIFKAKKITISDKGIREGILLDFIERNKRRIQNAPARTLGIREESVRRLCRRCLFDEAHAEHVTRLALDLFDRTKSLHRLGEDQKELLKYASLLHDIGHYVSFKKHHKHTYYLIVNSDLAGFGPEEVRMIGLIARHHRKKFRFEKTDPVDKESRRVARVLSAILRIADGLDRSHFAVVKSLDCRITRSKVLIRVRASKDPELELWQAKARADLFERTFKRKVVFRVVGKASSRTKFRQRTDPPML